VTRRRTWWAAFALLFSLAGLWSLASPLFSVPDEPSHVVKAAAVARGQFFGREIKTPNGVISFVKVPLVFARSHEISPCFAFKPSVTPDCSPPFRGPRRSGTVSTAIGPYPPAYYFVVGLPSLVFPSALGVHLMRLVGAALAAGLLASAFICSLESDKCKPLVLGAAVAATPMTLFLAGSVNPNGLEIAAAIGLWAAMVALVSGGAGAANTGRLAARAGTAGSALVLSRPLSPLWAAMIIGAVVVFFGGRRLRSLAEVPAVLAWTCVLVGCALFTTAWVIGAHTLNALAGQGVPATMTTGEIVAASLGKTGGNLLQMVGVFGWLDTPSPLVTYYAWFACVGLFGLLALSRPALRPVAVLSVLALLVVVMPVAIETADARSIGFGWQGRYGLPLAAGIPILASYLAGDALLGLGRRLWALIAGVLGIAHVAAFAWALHRYMVGVDGSFFPSSAKWSPPVPALVLLVAFAATVGIGVRWVSLYRRTEARSDLAFPAN